MAFNRNQIKKILYKEKPIAERTKIEAELEGVCFYHYECITSVGKFKFIVPSYDMGEKIFSEDEPAQLLIRWLEIKE